MKYLVTGGAGFIGSHIVDALVERGDEVRVLDNFSTGARSNIADHTIHIIDGDIRNPDVCDVAVHAMDYVLHQAAIPSVQRSTREPVRIHSVNVTGTLNLLEAARRAGVKRFVFASSSSVYGDSALLPKVETMPTNPKSPYAAQKAAAEVYCRLYSELYGLPTVILRYFNVFGPRQDPGSEYSAVIPRFVKAVRGGRPATIYGDGEQTRDFTPVENVVQANLLACKTIWPARSVTLNIATGRQTSLNTLLKTIFELAGTPDPRGAVTLARYEKAREGDVRYSMASIDRAGMIMGYQPAVDLEEGLRRLLK